MRTKERQKMLDDLMTSPNADQMDFVVTRKDPKPNETFSKDALTELGQTVNDFINARVIYHWYKGDGAIDPAVPGPSNIKVEVRLTIDDESYPPLVNSERPWFVIDGRHRT